MQVVGPYLQLQQYFYIENKKVTIIWKKMLSFCATVYNKEEMLVNIPSQIGPLKAGTNYPQAYWRVFPVN